ncbi:MAG: hypothetical protein ACK5Q0_02385 [Lysobacteraceae bacterium]
MNRPFPLVALCLGLCVPPVAAASPPAPLPPTHVPAPVPAAPAIDTVVGSVDLPWPVKVVSSRETLTLSGATTVLHLQGTEGDMAGRPVVLVANYSKPPKNPVLNWSSLLQENVEAVAGTGKARVADLFRIDGFDFALLDYRPAETPIALSTGGDGPVRFRDPVDTGLERTVEIVGVVSGSLVRVTVGLPDLAIDPSALHARLRAWKPDVTRLLRLASRLKERNDSLIRGPVVTLVNTRLDFQKDMEIKLVGESILRDASSRIVGRAQTINLNRVGFWTAQAVNVRASCEFLERDEGADRMTLEDWLVDETADGDVEMTPAEAMTLSRVAGQVRKAKIREPYRTFDGFLWIGGTAEHEHQLEIIRVMSGGVERRILEQVDAQPLECRLDGA